MYPRNASASIVSGFDANEIVGKPLADFIKQDSRIIVENMIRDFQDGVENDLFRGIVPLETKNENKVELLLAQLTSKQSHGGVGRFIGLMYFFNFLIAIKVAQKSDSLLAGFLVLSTSLVHLFLELTQMVMSIYGIRRFRGVLCYSPMKFGKIILAFFIKTTR